ncbi:MAG: hypothetical protein CSYNP_00048 [Syntrophus sp. SKADARSKE-3]|nr:hypothetical protein [Syntrophus sp. SKADARSKE-3]
MSYLQWEILPFREAMALNSNGRKGFLVLEILIAGLILTSSIAATMYMFHMGSLYLDKVNQSNMLSSKLIQVSNIFKVVPLENSSGTEDMGDGVLMTWKSQLISSAKPQIGEGEDALPSLHELMLYLVSFDLAYQGNTRSYQINVFRYKPLSSGETD